MQPVAVGFAGRQGVATQTARRPLASVPVGCSLLETPNLGVHATFGPILPSPLRPFLLPSKELHILM